MHVHIGGDAVFVAPIQEVRLKPIDINYLAVIAAAVATFAIGALWYSALFAKPWMAAHGYTPETLESMRKGMPRAYAMSFVANLVMAAAIAILVGYLGLARPLQGMKLGLLLWAGFIATVGLTNLVYSNRRPATYYIDAGYQLVFMVVMGGIIAGWR